MPTNLQTFKRFTNNNIFVETGTYIGNGVDLACNAGFKTVISIEIDQKLYDMAVKNYRPYNFIHLYKGDSIDVLPVAIKDINEPITFWLDGHFSGGITGTGKYLCPIIQELEAIKQHHIKTHTILIDDIRCWKEMNNMYHKDFNVDTIVNKIMEINPLYKISYADGEQVSGEILPNDILVAIV